MRNDVVLNIHSQSVEAGNFRFIIPQEMRKMGRSLKHGSRVFLIQGGPAATKGWRDFQETFNVDGPEAARLVSWYYNLLVQLYLNGLSTEDVQKILLSEPTSYLPRDFWEATGKPKNPAFILVSSGARAILGAHARVTEERLEWKLEPRYAGLFTRITALAIAELSLFKNGEDDFLAGWVWRDRKISSWRDLGKPFGATRSWFVYRYYPSNKTAACTYYNRHVVEDGDWDRNIALPRARSQVVCNSLVLDAWRKPKKALVLNPVKLLREKKKITWFS